jgi:periplasmic copper chaperone A
MRLIPLAPLAALLLAGCDAKPPEAAAAVEQAWVQLPAVPGRPGAAYFTLRSNANSGRLISVTSPRVGRIELHGTSMEGGVARMRPLSEPSIENGELVFAPGGNHAMLFDIDPALKAGDRMPLTFALDPLAAVSVEADVRAFGEGHAGH